MQEKVCLGIVRHVMDIHSIFFPVCSKIFLEKQSFKSLFETQPACAS